MKLNPEKKVTIKQALLAAEELGLDWAEVGFSPKDLAAGMTIELEHGTASGDYLLNVTNDELLATTKIALAHLFENADYYRILKKVGL